MSYYMLLYRKFLSVFIFCSIVSIHGMHKSKSNSPKGSPLSGSPKNNSPLNGSPKSTSPLTSSPQTVAKKIKQNLLKPAVYDAEAKKLIEALEAPTQNVTPAQIKEAVDNFNELIKKIKVGQLS